MLAQIQQETRRHGHECRLVPSARLRDLRAEIDEFAAREDLNGFQRYIAASMYQFAPPAAAFPIRSLILIAAPAPAHAEVVFHRRGRRLAALCLARNYPGRDLPAEETEKYLTALLAPAGYHLLPAPSVPLKRLAVRSGLAAYGRNNICYVEGMGSILSFAAFYTDVPCEDGGWHELRALERCGACTACQKNCPTGAIRPDRFLIDNERCLSYLNEGPGDFPAWLPPSAHHCLYDCLICQRVCPQNQDRLGTGIGPYEFDEAETDLLLAGTALPDLPPALRERVRFLGIDDYLAVMPRNLGVLWGGAEERRSGGVKE